MRYYLLLWPVWLVLVLEAFSRADPVSAVRWAGTGLPLLFLTLLVAAGLLLLLTGLTGRPRVAFWGLAGTLTVFAGVSGIKLRLKGAPLLPTDFALAGETLSVASWREILTPGLLAGVAGFVVVSFILLHRWPGAPLARPGRKQRAAMAAAGLLLSVLSFLAAGSGGAWDQAENVRSHGFLLTMVGNLRVLATGQARPTMAEAATVAAAVRASAGGTTAGVQPGGAAGTRPGATPEHPNIVIVLSESLWDPTNMKELNFSPDPLPFLHALQQRFPSGTMLSPEFGGSTANVELEVLTGLSMRFLPDGVVAYEKYINRPVDSLAAISARQGYRTTVISPWPSWFFNASTVYRNLGFQKFISSELINPAYEHPYIQDSEVAARIIGELSAGPGPHFIFANTAENHWGYNPGKFPANTVKVTGLGDEEAVGLLETYAEGCLHADRMLQSLVEQITRSGEPTILVFFGDHLPVLGSNYLAYREGKYLGDETGADFLRKMYRVPVLVWNNYLPDRNEQIGFSTAFLGPYLLDMAGLPGTPFTGFLRQQAGRTPLVPPRGLWPAFGLTDESFREYQALQQDILFGDQAVYAGYSDRIASPELMVGDGPPTVRTAEVQGQGQDQPDGEVTLALTGERFPPTAVVYLDGKPLPTTWAGTGLLLARAPRERLSAGPATLEAGVPVAEDPGKLLLRSNSWTLEISPGQ